LEEMGAVRIGDRFEIDVVDYPIPEDNISKWISLWIEDLNDL
jgi:MioC protein